MTASPEPNSSRASGANAPIASRYIRALLSRHGVSSMRHVTTAAQILGMGYTLVYRRMNGAVAWELEEIEKVAAHFGESLADVFAGGRGDDSVPATFGVGGMRLPCRLVVGGKARDPGRDSLVAVKAGDDWLVVGGLEAGVLPAFEATRVLITRDAERRKRIAVLDDDADDAASLKEHFQAHGCEAQAFSTVEDLVAHMKVRPFDAYIVDWVLGENTAAELLGMIRADDRQCPIAVLTGKMKDDFMIEPAVAEAVATYKLLFFEKPTRLPIISAQVFHALGSR